MKITLSAWQTLMEHAPEHPFVLRVFVEGGGCSGMKYGFEFESSQQWSNTHPMLFGSVLNQPGDRDRTQTDSQALVFLETTTVDDEWVLRRAEGCVVIDPVSYPYLQMATLDFQSDLMGARFVFSNPHVSHHCGCGQSFEPF